MFLRLKGTLTGMASIMNGPMTDVSKVEGKVNWRMAWLLL